MRRQRTDRERYEIAHAAAWDTGNRHARAKGRDTWNEDDYNACVEEFNRLMPIEGEQHDHQRQDHKRHYRASTR